MTVRLPDKLSEGLGLIVRLSEAVFVRDVERLGDTLTEGDTVLLTVCDKELELDREGVPIVSVALTLTLRDGVGTFETVSV